MKLLRSDRMLNTSIFAPVSCERMRLISAIPSICSPSEREIDDGDLGLMLDEGLITGVRVMG